MKAYILHTHFKNEEQYFEFNPNSEKNNLWEFPRRSFACERTGCVYLAKKSIQKLYSSPHLAFQTIITL